MFWGKGKRKPHTIDLRKKGSIFGVKTKKEKDSEKNIGCIICNKKISNKPIFCNQYLTRTKLCNAGPFCSEPCWNKHLKNTIHY